MDRLAGALRPGGVFSLWSNDPPDDAFVAVLDDAFDKVAAEVVTFAERVDRSPRRAARSTSPPGGRRSPTSYTWTTEIATASQAYFFSMRRRRVGRELVGERRVAEDHLDRVGQIVGVAWLEGEPGIGVDDQFGEPTGSCHDQRSTRCECLERHDAERLVERGNHDAAGPVDERPQLVVAEEAGEVDQVADALDVDLGLQFGEVAASAGDHTRHVRDPGPKRASSPVPGPGTPSRTGRVPTRRSAAPARPVGRARPRGAGRSRSGCGRPARVPVRTR